MLIYCLSTYEAYVLHLLREGTLDVRTDGQTLLQSCEDACEKNGAQIRTTLS